MLCSRSRKKVVGAAIIWNEACISPLMSGSPGYVAPISSRNCSPSVTVSSPSACIPTKATSPPPGVPYF